MIKKFNIGKIIYQISIVLLFVLEAFLAKKITHNDFQIRILQQLIIMGFGFSIYRKTTSYQSMYPYSVFPINYRKATYYRLLHSFRNFFNIFFILCIPPLLSGESYFSKIVMCIVMIIFTILFSCFIIVYEDFCEKNGLKDYSILLFAILIVSTSSISTYLAQFSYFEINYLLPVLIIFIIVFTLSMIMSKILSRKSLIN